MRTIHRPGHGLRAVPGGAVVAGDALVVDGGTVLARGPYEEVADRYGGPGARVREWDGLLAPGAWEPDAAVLLEGVYWPDPREDLGTDPLPLPAREMTGSRFGESARRGVRALLARGVTAAGGSFTHPQVRDAVRRAGLRAEPAAALEPGARADFAVFAADGRCLATVLGGRLVHRRA